MLNAARHTLRHLYQTTPGGYSGAGDENLQELPSNPSVLRELISLHSKLSAKRELVVQILDDVSFLKQVEELFSVYEAEINLLTEMAQQTVSKTTAFRTKYSTSASLSSYTDNADSNPLFSSTVRSTDEFIYSLSKACQQQLALEKKLTHLLEKNAFGAMDKSLHDNGRRGDPTLAPLEANKMIHSSTSNNPLLLVLRNVF